MATLRHFLRAYCVEHPAARTPLVEFVRAFQESLTAQDQAEWPRGRVVNELIAAGFEVGRCPDKRFWLAGVALKGEWTAKDGRLVLAERR